MNRRTFLKAAAGILGAGWVAGVIYPIFRYLQRPEEVVKKTKVALCKVNDIAPGESKTFQFASKPALLVRDQEGHFKAFDATCTHLGCTVQFRKAEKDIYCACHAGVYNLEGGNVSGPPPKPLQAYTVTVEGDEVVVIPS